MHYFFLFVDLYRVDDMALSGVMETVRTITIFSGMMDSQGAYKRNALSGSNY